MYSYCIVIVTYNRLELLKECLEHAKHQTLEAEKIIVVDNCSTDGTREYLQQYQKDPKVCVSLEKENSGGAGGFHRGMQLALEAGSEWIMVIDDDAILNYDCMEKMDPKTSAISASAYACVVTCDDQIDTMHRRNKESDIESAEYKKGDFACDFASFCGLLVHRSIVEKIGLPIKEYFIWFDDTEYCMRINQYSKIAVRVEASLNHKTKMEQPKKGESQISWKQYYGTRNRIDAYRRHGYWKLLLQEVTLTLMQVAVNYVKSLHNPQYSNKATILFDAVIDGMRGRLGKNTIYMPGAKKK